MKSVLHRTFLQLKLFITGSGKNVLFTAIFYSLWMVIHYAESIDFDLVNFNHRMISSATIVGFDVAARVSLFYKCLFIFLLSLGLFYILAWLLNKAKNRLFSSAELRLMNAVSLIGILFYFIHVYTNPEKDLFKSDLKDSLELVYLLHKLMLGALLVRFFVGFRKKELVTLSIAQYSIIICLAYSLYFIIADLSIVMGSEIAPDFLSLTFTMALLLIIAAQLISSAGHSSQLRKSAWVLVPLSFTPFLSFLKDEIYLIYKGHGILLQNRLPAYLITLFILLAFVFLRYYRSKKNKQLLDSKREEQMLARGYFPALLFSILCFALYQPFINTYQETFESGNRYLPIMEFRNWGVLPIFEKMNSHMLSDFAYNAIYVLFNDMRGIEMELYDFLAAAVIGLLYYYLFYYLTRNAYIALFAVIFFPYFNALCPNEHAFTVLGIGVLFRLTEEAPSLKNYLAFISMIIFLILWRIDVGFACLIFMPTLFICYSIFTKKVRIDFRLLLKAFSIVAAVLLTALLVISYVRKINVFDRALYAVNYLSSTQTYGYDSLGNPGDTNYKIHYFIFPAIIAGIFIVLLLRFKQLNKTRRARLAYLSLLSLCCYYLINVQRGLVRHSLIEGIDSFITSFAYIIMTFSAFIFLYKRSHYFKFILFFVIGFFVLTSYKMPVVREIKTAHELSQRKLEKAVPDLNAYKTRTVDDNFQLEQADIVRFMKENLDSNETFVDFNNFPLLYYYTNKETPSYFFQNPLCSHNEFLQKRFISDLKDYNTPFLVFQKTTPGFNAVDNVPNYLRHYRIAEYIYSNYTPYIIVSGYCIWRKNDKKVELPEVKPLWYFDSSTDSIGTKPPLIKLERRKKYLAKVVLKTGEDSPLEFKQDGQSFNVVQNYTDKLQKVWYYEIKTGDKECLVDAKDWYNIRRLNISSGERMADYYSGKHELVNMSRLPYIWGKYDEEYKTEATLFSESRSFTLIKDRAKEIDIPATIDKSSGNTIILKLKNLGKRSPLVELAIKDEDQRTLATVYFDVLPLKEEQTYAIRISALYNWYANKISKLTLTPFEKGIHISGLKITKAK